jgi:hypothetical protein
MIIQNQERTAASLTALETGQKYIADGIDAILKKDEQEDWTALLNNNGFIAKEFYAIPGLL